MMGSKRWQKRPHEVLQDNGLIAECLRLWGAGLDTKEISLLVFQPEYIVQTATRLGRERRRTEGLNAAGRDAEKT
jgi:hypothetical protein